MYISNMTHFLDKTGNIPKQMPKEGREMARFLALVVDTTTKKMPTSLTSTDIRCFEKRCEGTINSELLRKFTTNENIMENSFYYFFSAVPQVLGGVLALFGVFIVFKVQSLKTQLLGNE